MTDGDGWVDCSCGSRHWGRHGAAGIVILHPTHPQVLMQLRAHWTHGGQTWGFPGGARDSTEAPAQAALRELHEEFGVRAAQVDVIHEQVWTDHGDWRYHTVIAAALDNLTPVLNEESAEARWVHIDDVADLDLHPALAMVWVHVLATIKVLRPDR
jgi:8-oxo-dGTP diphosphatase